MKKKKKRARESYGGYTGGEREERANEKDGEVHKKATGNRYFVRIWSE